MRTRLSLDYNANSATFIHRRFIFSSPLKAILKIDLNVYLATLSTKVFHGKGLVLGLARKIIFSPAWDCEDNFFLKYSSSEKREKYILWLNSSHSSVLYHFYWGFSATWLGLPNCFFPQVTTSDIITFLLHLHSSFPFKYQRTREYQTEIKYNLEKFEMKSICMETFGDLLWIFYKIAYIILSLFNCEFSRWHKEVKSMFRYA